MVREPAVPLHGVLSSMPKGREGGRERERATERYPLVGYGWMKLKGSHDFVGLLPTIQVDSHDGGT